MPCSAPKRLLRRLPVFPLNLEAKLIAGALGLALLCAGALYLVHKGKQEARAEAAAAQVVQQQKDAAETERRVSEQARIANDATVQADHARADAAAAGRARDALRVQLNAFVANARSADPAPSAASAPTGDALDVLADLFSRSDETSGELAAALDASHTAGQACERAYESLNHAP